MRRVAPLFLTFAALALLALPACTREQDKSASRSGAAQPRAAVAQPDDADFDPDVHTPLRSVTLQPAEPKTGMALRVDIDDPVTGRLYDIAWFIDGEPVRGESGTMLGGNYVRRGVEIAVEVTPLRNDEEGPTDSAAVIVGNTAPDVKEIRLVSSSAASAVFQVVATDIDGDELTYELVEALPGMEISDSGRITWQAPAGFAGGKFTVGVSDGEQTILLENEIGTREEQAAND
jgi:hypothetical protein